MAIENINFQTSVFTGTGQKETFGEQLSRLVIGSVNLGNQYIKMQEDESKLKLSELQVETESKIARYRIDNPNATAEDLRVQYDVTKGSQLDAVEKLTKKDKLKYDLMYAQYDSAVSTKLENEFATKDMARVNRSIVEAKSSLLNGISSKKITEDNFEIEYDALETKLRENITTQNSVEAERQNHAVDVALYNMRKEAEADFVSLRNSAKTLKAEQDKLIKEQSTKTSNYLEMLVAEAIQTNSQEREEVIKDKMLDVIMNNEEKLGSLTDVDKYKFFKTFAEKITTFDNKIKTRETKKEEKYILEVAAPMAKNVAELKELMLTPKHNNYTLKELINSKLDFATTALQNGYNAEMFKGVDKSTVLEQLGLKDFISEIKDPTAIPTEFTKILGKIDEDYKKETYNANIIKEGIESTALFYNKDIDEVRNDASSLLSILAKDPKKRDSAIKFATDNRLYIGALEGEGEYFMKSITSNPVGSQQEFLKVKSNIEKGYTYKNQAITEQYRFMNDVAEMYNIDVNDANGYTNLGSIIQDLKENKMTYDPVEFKDRIENFDIDAQPEASRYMKRFLEAGVGIDKAEELTKQYIKKIVFGSQTGDKIKTNYSGTLVRSDSDVDTFITNINLMRGGGSDVDMISRVGDSFMIVSEDPTIMPTEFINIETFNSILTRTHPKFKELKGGYDKYGRQIK